MPTYNNLFTYERKTIEGGKTVYHICTLLRDMEELKKDQVVPCIIPTISLLVWTSEEDQTEYTEVYTQ